MLKSLLQITTRGNFTHQVAKQQRERLNRITKKFNHLAAGIYPFALEMSEDGERLISEKEFEDEERNLKIEVRQSCHLV